MKRFSATDFFIMELRRKYPDANKFTDLLFLEGLKWQMLAKTDSARLCFNKFLNFSGSKYSLRFRGYYFSDSANIEFANERLYAKSFLKYEKQDSASFFKTDIFRKYYYESFSQGFVLNREDFGNRKIIPLIGLRIGSKGSYIYGIGCYWLARDNIVAGCRFSFNNYYLGALADIPLQIYKSSDNSLGIKLTPLVYFQYLTKPEATENIINIYINPGAGLSAGYHFSQRVYAGVSYLYFLYNQYNKAYPYDKINEIFQQNVQIRKTNPAPAQTNPSRIQT